MTNQSRIIQAGLLAGVAVLGLMGQSTQSPGAPRVEQLEKQVKVLRQEVSDLKSKQATTTMRLSTIQAEVDDTNKKVADVVSNSQFFAGQFFSMQTSINATKRVDLDLASPNKYQRIDSSTGSFLVSVEDAVPYLDGYRIILNIGNPSSATYAGFTVKVRWGKKYDWSKFDVAAYQEWDKSVREKQVTFTQSLKPATWNKAEVILPSTAAEQVAFLEVALDTDTVSLIKER